MKITQEQESHFFLQRAKEDFLSFCVFSDQRFQIIKHHKLIADALVQLSEGTIKKLAICMPPRAGKSRLIQEYISWVFGNNPQMSIIYTGHSLSLLQGFSRHIRDRINDRMYKQAFKNTEISSDSSAVNNWNIKNGGEFAIYGVGGGITGKGGDILIIDDPYGTRADVESDTIRKKVSDWYWSTLLSRRQTDEAKQIIIMQRWREDDLIGEILEKEKDWTVLKIPALDEKGESFWNEKFSKEFLEDIQNKSPLYFLSQYQQEPTGGGLGDFNREQFKYYEEQELYGRLERMDIVTFIDPAISQTQEADYTAIVTVGHDSASNIKYILEVKHLKELPDEILRELFDTAKCFVGKGESYRSGIEIVAFQKMLSLAIKDKMQKDDFYFDLQEVSPRGEKNARIRTILQPLYSSGSIIHPHGINIPKLEMELLTFPNGKHDDIIDALSQACSLQESTSLSGGKNRVVSQYSGNNIGLYNPNSH